MTDETINIEGAVCAPPLTHNEQIVMGHGAGGRMSHQLIQKAFMSAFDNPALRAGDDAARLESDLHQNLAISTDSHVVFPLFFPGGDIGRLAVCGTVNDVAMLGASPLYLTAGFILEEGLPMETLQRVVASMKAAADEAGVQIVAGDTKVVQKGKADGLYITTAGVGVIQKRCYSSAEHKLKLAMQSSSLVRSEIMALQCLVRAANWDSNPQFKAMLRRSII